MRSWPSPGRAWPPAARGSPNGLITPPSEQVEKLKPELRKRIDAVLTEQLRHAAVAPAARPAGGLASPPEARGDGLRCGTASSAMG